MASVMQLVVQKTFWQIEERDATEPMMRTRPRAMSLPCVKRLGEKLHSDEYDADLDLSDCVSTAASSHQDGGCEWMCSAAGESWADMSDEDLGSESGSALSSIAYSGPAGALMALSICATVPPGIFMQPQSSQLTQPGHLAATSDCSGPPGVFNVVSSPRTGGPPGVLGLRSSPSGPPGSFEKPRLMGPPGTFTSL